jgi:integrase
MKRIKLPINRRHKGLIIFCNKCNKAFSWTKKSEKDLEGKTIIKEPVCGKDKTKFSYCQFFKMHRFKVKVFIPGSGGKYRTKNLNITNYSQAVSAAISFEKEVKLSYHNLNSSLKIYGKEILLLEAQAEYKNYLLNVNVPAHQKRERTKKYIKEIEYCLNLFNKALTENRVNISKLKVNSVKDGHIGIFHTYLLEKMSYSAVSYNNKMQYLKSFFTWSIQEFRIDVNNPFNKVRRRKSVLKKEIITLVEYEELLEIISPKLGFQTIQGKNRTYRKQRYKSYLKDGIELGLYTGARREEIIQLKWNMIHIENDIPIFIEVRNFKVERQKGDGYNANVAPKIIPVIKNLYDLLLRMGYKEKVGSDEYILFPERNITIDVLKDNLSRGFSHFYNLLNIGKDLQFKHLRKTYLTYLEMTMKDDAGFLSSHTSKEVLRRHYINENVVLKAMREVEIFKKR